MRLSSLSFAAVVAFAATSSAFSLDSNNPLTHIFASRAAVGATCGPAKCYPESCRVRTSVDIVFAIDTSGSMTPHIANTASGLTRFLNQLLSRNVDPRFAVVSFATGKGLLDVPLTADITTVKNKFNDYIGKTKGGHEEGMTVMRNILNAAAADNLNLAFRDTAKKVIVVVTDEDSDPSKNPLNRPPGQVAQDQACFKNATFTDAQWQPFQVEIDMTAKALIDRDVLTYMTVSPLTSPDKDRCNLRYQYGDPTRQVQNANLTGFNALGTLKSVTDAGFGKSIQAQMLSVNKICRLFDVTKIAENDLINAVFDAITADVADCNPCRKYVCDPARPTKCMPEENICGCDGKPGNKVNDCFNVCGGTGILDPNDCRKIERRVDAVCRTPADEWKTNPCGQCVPKNDTTDCNERDQCGQLKRNATRLPCLEGCFGKFYLGPQQPDLTPCCGKVGANATIVRDACGNCGTRFTKDDLALTEDGLCPCDPLNNGTFVPRKPFTCPDGKQYCGREEDGTPACPPPPVVCSKPLVCGKCPENRTITLGPCGECPGVEASADICDVCPSSKDYGLGKNFCGVCVFNQTQACVQDCRGVWGGSAFVDCLGTCVDNPSQASAACAKTLCGNGIVDVGEECDFLNDSNCTDECKRKSGLGTGAIVGIAAGVAGAAVALAGGAFFFHRYMVKSGIMSSKTEVDMGSSNANPLYHGNAQVSENPLYRS